MLYRLALLAFVLLWPSLAYGQQCADGTCVTNEDLKVFVQLLKEKKCLQETKPLYTLDPIAIIVDKDGRIYSSGSNPQPYKVHMDWCSYSVDAAGDTKIVAAVKEPDAYGFRFRVKATLGLLLVDTFRKDSKWSNGIDGGLLLEPFYFRFANINAYIGVRSIGVGLGFDLTRNFGAYLGYGVTWSKWASNPYLGAYFAF